MAQLQTSVTAALNTAGSFEVSGLIPAVPYGHHMATVDIKVDLVNQRAMTVIPVDGGGSITEVLAHGHLVDAYQGTGLPADWGAGAPAPANNCIDSSSLAKSSVGSDLGGAYLLLTKGDLFGSWSSWTTTSPPPGAGGSSWALAAPANLRNISEELVFSGTNPPLPSQILFPANHITLTVSNYGGAFPIVLPTGCSSEAAYASALPH